MKGSHVLVALDGSPLADDALAYALATFDCRVTALNVVTPLDTSMSEGGILDAGEERRTAAEERTTTLVERVRERMADAGADNRVETAVETGDPAETIVEYVESHDIDQVVMGGHGGDRSELGRRLLGTVATSVVSEAPVTVTVVR